MESFDHLDWDNVKLFLALMRTKSLRRAAKLIDVSHPTARRRLDQLEGELGFSLFNRRTEGLIATEQAEALLPAAQEIERAVNQFGRSAKASDTELEGPIKVTLPNLLATDLLMPSFVAFAKEHPRINLELDVSYDVARLDRGEADIALRFIFADQSPQETLVGRKTSRIFSATYGEGDSWIGWRGGDRDQFWIQESEYPDYQTSCVMPDATLQRAACIAGLGLTRLPCFFADPHLARKSEPEHSFDLWVLVHPDLKRLERLRVFRDYIVGVIHENRWRLEGRAKRVDD